MENIIGDCDMRSSSSASTIPIDEFVMGGHEGASGGRCGGKNRRRKSNKANTCDPRECELLVVKASDWDDEK